MAESPDAAIVRANRIDEREKRWVSGLWGLGADFRMVGYLFAHEAVLQPVRTPDSLVYYKYPLAEALAEDGVDAMAWVERLAEMRLIEPDELVDRLRLCPECGSARLNYRDLCSACGALRIAKTSFLHCFTCGHVGEDETFLEDGRLICPNCKTRLRQIGSDYDRALESYLCRSCGARQSEPRVAAACISCGKSSAPEQLTVREIYSYRLSSRGENTVLLGSTDYLLTSLDILNFTRHDVFTGMVNWLLNLYRRYEDLCFGLIGIRLPNLTELVASLGHSQASAVMEVFSSKLRELVRDTDLVSRSDQGTIWLALPRTGVDGCEMVHNRIRKMQEEMVLADNSKLTFVSVGWCADTDSKMDSAELLLATLTSRLDEESR